MLAEFELGGQHGIAVDNVHKISETLALIGSRGAGKCQAFS